MSERLQPGSDGPGADLRRYHERTKHSVERLRADRYTLDWENQPLPYKIYPALTPIPLPREWPPATMPALDAIAAPNDLVESGSNDAPLPSRTPDGVATRDHRARDSRAVPTLARLARLLLLSAGIVRKSVYASGREHYFRAAACTGALYHVDVYVICGALPDLDAGVYHFAPHDFALRQLRAGDHRGIVVAASGDEPAIARAPVVLAYASTFWRNAWKYRGRAYRHCFWDSGTMIANALAAAAADALPTHVVLGFADPEVEHLLGLDPVREAALALLAVGRTIDRPPPPPRAPELALETVPLSPREIAYPEIPAAHAASALASGDEAGAWRTRRDVAEARHDTAAPCGERIALPPVERVPETSIDVVIRRRGSTRVFGRSPIGLAELSSALERSTRVIPADFLRRSTARLADVYVLVNAVDGLASGAYRYDPDAHAVEQIRTGEFRREAGLLALGQDLAADAAVDVFLLADLGAAFAAFGDRGYRAAQMEAAIRGGKLYLAAYALGLGATGLTFFDDDVTAFFSPCACGLDVMFLTAIGRPARRTSATGR